MPPDSNNHQRTISALRWATAFVLVISGAALIYAIQFHNWKLAQIASMAGLVLLGVGVGLLAVTLRRALSQGENSALVGDPEENEREKEKNRSKWLTRLVLVAAFGMAVIAVYAVQYDNWILARVASTASVGFITAGASWLVGALVGFLFGIPLMREQGTGMTKQSPTAGQSGAEDLPPAEQDSHYQPNTSLEQISDWLTKIIVGVGLTQLNKIPGRLDDLALYIASGMGGGTANKAFAMGITVHFSVCGFLFGYLWARLYLLEAFRAADLLKRVERLSSQMLDLRAKDLVESQLDRAKPEVSESELKEAIRKASQPAREKILDRAKEVRKEALPTLAPIIAGRTIPVFQALIDSDTANLFHHNHGQLGRALQDLGKWKQSENELTKAIQIRDRLRRGGWSYYELKRAIARIRLDTESPSSRDKDQILADLRRAHTEHSEKILRDKDIQAWLKRNALSVDDLEPQE
jgi:tetratricopeptide (TPR) repeat protein